ncbi:hypothetical protein [Oscillatoria sp. FACHB-1406]|nr:hypothetical protein [Oscillatoria sp. FACHB-1406]MBD2577458.1 hypothetical protein [Oscillatoria sp. FACHB-1406]
MPYLNFRQQLFLYAAIARYFQEDREKNYNPVFPPPHPSVVETGYLLLIS